jgi:adenylosuccinate lyase
MKEKISNVLAERYASSAMCAIWSPAGRIVLEREFWIAVMKAQRELGLSIPAEAITAYEAVKDQVDLEAIARREAVTRHDVKARIEAFCDLAGHEYLHQGLTSRDLTENVEQLQVYRTLLLIREKTIATLSALAHQAGAHRHTPLAARTHNVIAQPTTFGKRLAMFGEELLLALRGLDDLIERYPVRGLKGAVGTQMDQVTLFGGDSLKVAALEESVLRHLGLPAVLHNVGQVYPRSLDFAVISAFYAIGAGPSGFAKTLRLMAGHELASEGFAPGQTGSSAMPHKMNSRSCERLNGFHVILRGYLTMAEGLAGDQWNEGDVSCSVVRRVMLPDAAYATDGLLETALTILQQMEVYPAVLEQEIARYLPFLLTTTVLMEAVKRGVGREEAHGLVKKHALTTARALRAGEIRDNDLLDRLASEPALGLTREQLESVRREAEGQAGCAEDQVQRFIEQVADWVKRFPNATTIQPAPIL